MVRKLMVFPAQSALMVALGTTAVGATVGAAVGAAVAGAVVGTGAGVGVAAVPQAVRIIPNTANKQTIWPSFFIPSSYREYMSKFDIGSFDNSENSLLRAPPSALTSIISNFRLLLWHFLPRSTRQL